jgi:hypothetical protein
MLPYVERLAGASWFNDAYVGVPFLIGAGYGDRPAVADWFRRRIDALAEAVSDRNFDIYASPEEAERVPGAWREKMIYKPDRYREDRVFRLPCCWDLYGLAHWTPESTEQRSRIDLILEYLSDERFQGTPGGYVWDRPRRTCYAAGRVVLAVATPERRVLFLELAAGFEVCRRSSWFQSGLADLERYRTERGTWLLPASYLKEKRNGYYIYGGDHMGLGENRRRKDWREIESTFRVLNIQRLTGANA